MLTTLFILFGIFGVPSFAQESKEISVSIDGLPVSFDVPPLIENGRTLVPFRAIAEALQIQVSWDESSKAVYASNEKTAVLLQIGNQTAYCNQEPTFLEAAPKIANGRTLIPLRFFSEAFGCEVLWDASANSIKIVSPPQKMTVVGFYALGSGETSSWKDLFGAAYPNTAIGKTDRIGQIGLGWYSIDASGRLLDKSPTGWQRPSGWEDVLEAAEKYGLDTEMVVHAVDGDGTITGLLSSEERMQKAVQEIVEEASRYYNGVNLDWEGLGWSDTGEELIRVRERFTRFAALLKKSLKEKGLNLTLTLHAPNSAYKGYDYEALGKIADKIIVMAYDYGSKPEPVHLVKQAVEMASAVVPPEKLILGISAFSETPESIRTKIGIAKRYGLDGIAIWRLGLISDKMWDEIRAAVQQRGF